ncbi:MAG: PSD1 and planctomycete cytochrome C domain-containing protein [Planctomycetaceae bacterium]
MSRLRSAVVIAVIVVASSPFPGRAADENRNAGRARAEKLFTLKVLPLLKSKCCACHGANAKDVKGEFDVRSRAALLKGGESGKAAILPGQPAKSPLYRAVKWQGLEMPPKKNDRLNAKQVEWIRRWIAAGAPWPDEKRRRELLKSEWSQPATRDGVLVRTSGGLSGEWTYRRYKPSHLWAFRPVREPAVPKIAGASHPVDAFVRRRLAAAGLKPAPRADRRALIRRATFDLLGLPPTPVQIESFLNDSSPDAWPKLIERLLASPAYGEKWGQHWLDVTRYADTSGLSNDWERSNAWRYRDYVVRSFNADKPFNRFILEQIAGDELKPGDSEMRIAVGYLRMGPWEHTGMVPESVSRQQYLDDVVNAVGQTFLSLPLRCAKCHDHKFDPIPTRDYYRVYAAFATTQPVERPAAFLKSENRKRFAEGRKRLQKLVAWAEADVAKINAKEARAGREWAKRKGIPFVPRTFKNNDVPENRKPPRHIGLSYQDQGFFKVRRQDARIWARRLERYRPLAQSVYSGGFVRQNSQRLRIPEKPRERKQAQLLPRSHIYRGGNVNSPLDRVSPGVLSAVPNHPANSDATDPWRLPGGMSGRRLALARWIADTNNPLTTRSIVNRIWQHHFGVGIAANANNFGNTGAMPTHPRLLDWLAARFVKDGWSVKKMHRLIMTSQTYQQSCRHPQIEAVKNADPSGTLLARFRPRRLTAEELRDGMLAVTGELNREVGGLPIFPEINREVALAPRMLQSSLAPAYQPSRTPAERNRRSIYVYRCRGLADPLSNVFNKPTSNDSCERRDSSSVTPQVFALMNSDAATKRSLAFALRLEKERTTASERIDRAVRLAFGRKPTKAEQRTLGNYLQTMIAYHRRHPPKAKQPPTKITRSVVEEMSGLAFDYVERLDLYENYVPDPQPSKVSAETRALADVCLVLLNANEFLYVY